MNNGDITFDRLVEELYVVKSWLQGLGIRDLDESRLPAIIEYSGQLSSEFLKHSKGQSNDLLNLKRDVETAVYEGLALITIYRGLSDFRSRLLKNKLKECIRGSFSSLDEKALDNSNQARNTLFELETNSYIRMRNLNFIPEFEDVNFTVDKYKVSIQCKRPLTEAKLEDNIIDAYNQLITNNHIKEDVTSYGIIAISWEKLYELDKIRSVKNRNELRMIMAEYYNDCMSKIKPSLKIITSTTKLLGIMFFFKSPIVFKDTGVLYGVNIFNFYFPKKSYPTPRRKIFQGLQKLTRIRIGQKEFL